MFELTDHDYMHAICMLYADLWMCTDMTSILLPRHLDVRPCSKCYRHKSSNPNPNLLHPRQPHTLVALSTPSASMPDVIECPAAG